MGFAGNSCLSGDRMIGLKYGIDWLPDNSDLFVIVALPLPILWAVWNCWRALGATILLLWATYADAAGMKQWKHHATTIAQTQGDCIAAYLAVCGGVPLNETAIRACIAAHKFSPQCLELMK
jgi:hypothetical protein